jgi:hypothetical protein
MCVKRYKSASDYPFVIFKLFLRNDGNHILDITGGNLSDATTKSKTLNIKMFSLHAHLSSSLKKILFLFPINYPP